MPPPPFCVFPWSQGMLLGSKESHLSQEPTESHTDLLTRLQNLTVLKETQNGGKVSPHQNIATYFYTQWRF